MPTATHDELTLIKKYLVLPLVRSVFERDAKTLHEVLKTPDPYVERINRGIEYINDDLMKVRKYFRANDIKVYDVELTTSDLSCGYTCRGYTGSMRLLMSTLRSEVEVEMRKYLGEDIRELRKGPSNIV
ncbi:hypothetical protein ABND12_12755 [Paenibacillus larvae]